MKKLTLNHLLNLSEEECKNTKIKFNQWGNGAWPLDTFLHNPDRVNNLNLFWRADRRYFNVGEIAINFVQMDQDKWLLTTIKRITKELGVKQGQNYLGEEMSQFAPYFGRLVIHLKKRVA